MPRCTPIRAFKNRLAVPVLLVFILTLTGCIAVKPASTPLRTVADEASGAERQARLRAEAADWAGTPHRWGGTTRDGIDCSAFVQTVYRDLFTVDLPRTTIQQSKAGQATLLTDLTAGDLVFYRIDSATRHVGIYVGANEFMHASKSEGVTISSIEDPYWQRRFWTVRRILAPAADSIAVGSNAEKSRSGW